MKAIFYSILFFVVISSNNYGVEEEKKFFVTGGPRANETVTIKETLLLTPLTSGQLQNPQILDILLKRISDLPHKQKIQFISLLKKTNEKSLETLPQSIKNGCICLCLSQNNEEHYIDERFLKERN